MVSEFAPYVIRRSTRARRTRLTVTEEGEALVVLPMRASEREAADLYNQHRAWVKRQQAKMREQRIELAMRPSLAAGRVLTINGRAQIARVRNELERQALEQRLRREARTVLSQRVAIRAWQMGVSPGTIQIRDQKSRWGSASRNGTLSFSWRLILAPPEVLDYVVVHELAHLRWSGHGKRFWAMVERHYGDHDDARRWLREHNEEVRRALD